MGGEEGKSEDILQALTEFSEMSPSQKALTPELESALEHIARTGQLHYPWKLVRGVVLFKIEKVVQDFFESSQFPDDEHPQAEFQSLKAAILGRYDRFQINPPFTIQRICELLVSPYSGYANCLKFMRGLLKNIKVNSMIGHSSCNGTVVNWPPWDSECNGRSSPSAQPSVPASSAAVTAGVCETEEVFTVETVHPPSSPSLPSPYSPPLSPTAEDSRVVDNRPNAELTPNGSLHSEEVVINGSHSEHSELDSDGRETREEQSEVSTESGDSVSSEVSTESGDSVSTEPPAAEEQETPDSTSKGLDAG